MNPFKPKYKSGTVIIWPKQNESILEAVDRLIKNGIKVKEIKYEEPKIHKCPKCEFVNIKSKGITIIGQKNDE